MNNVELYAKTLRVIISCNTADQRVAAMRYIELAARFRSQAATTFSEKIVNLFKKWRIL